MEPANWKTSGNFNKKTSGHVRFQESPPQESTNSQELITINAKHGA